MARYESLSGRGVGHAVGLAMVVLTMAVCGPASRGAVIESVWTLALGDWFDANNWTPPGIPNNSAGTDFNVSFANSGLVAEVDQSVTISRLTLNGSSIQRAAGVSGLVRFEALGGAYSGSAEAQHRLVGLDFYSAGGDITAGNLELAEGTIYHNTGTLNVDHVGAAQRSMSRDASSAEFRNEAGATVNINSQLLSIDLPVVNAGTIDTHADTLRLNAGYTQTGSGSQLILSGGSLETPAGLPLVIAEGSFHAAGTLNADLFVGIGELAQPVGSVFEVGGAGIIGQVQLNGNNTIRGTGGLAISLAAAPEGGPGIAYDFVNVAQKLTVNSGILVLRVLGGFQPQVGQTFPFLTAGSLAGPGFANLSGGFSGALQSGPYGFNVSQSLTGLSLTVTSVPEPTHAVTLSALLSLVFGIAFRVARGGQAAHR